jgi:hypothetical protein
MVVRPKHVADNLNKIEKLLKWSCIRRKPLNLISDNSSIWHGIWAKSCVEQPFPFTSKPGINVDLEDPSNIMSCFVHQKVQK